MPRIGQVVQRVAAPIFSKQGFSQGRIITDWPEIVGEKIASYGVPEKITFPFQKKSGGTLHIMASGSGGMMFQYQSALIIERINTYFGYNAVAKIQLHNTPMAAPEASKPKPTPVDERLEKKARKDLKSLEEGALKEALLHLNTSILSS